MYDVTFSECAALIGTPEPVPYESICCLVRGGAGQLPRISLNFEIVAVQLKNVS